MGICGVSVQSCPRNQWKSLPHHQSANAYYLVETQFLLHREDPKYPSTCLAREWHVQLAAHLNFEGDNINQCQTTKHAKLRMSLNILLNKWSLYAKENKILETCEMVHVSNQEVRRHSKLWSLHGFKNNSKLWFN